MQISDTAEAVEHHLPDEVIALALQILIREEMTRANHEQLSWEIKRLKLYWSVQAPSAEKTVDLMLLWAVRGPADFLKS